MYKDLSKPYGWGFSVDERRQKHIDTAYLIILKLEPLLYKRGFSKKDLSILKAAVYYHDIGYDGELNPTEKHHEGVGAAHLSVYYKEYNIPYANEVIKLVANHGLHRNYNGVNGYTFEFERIEGYKIKRGSRLESLLEILDYCDISAGAGFVVNSNDRFLDIYQRCLNKPHILGNLIIKKEEFMNFTAKVESKYRIEKGYLLCLN